jgi:CheY-like chemotaxis protein
MGISVSKVLLSVEDDDADYYMLGEAIKFLKLEIVTYRTEDGEEAMKFLQHKEPFEGVPWPNLILLDLNLPRKNGFEVLSEMRAQECLRDLPCVVFSSSKRESDRAKCLDLGATTYITKPSNWDGLLQAVQKAYSYASV